jgi:hypothetical protein
MKGSSQPAAEFLDSPEHLLETVNNYTHKPLKDYEARL